MMKTKSSSMGRDGESQKPLEDLDLSKEPPIEASCEDYESLDEEFTLIDFESLSKTDWKRIYRAFPELKKRREPPLDEFVIEFLKKFDVYITPVTTGTRRKIGEGVVEGAIAGAFGADVAGDAFIISGQKRQTAIQEWTQWKQWALDHPDFNDFVQWHRERADRHNARVEELLASEEVQKEILSLINQPEHKEEKSSKFNYGLILPLVGVLILLVFVVIKFLL